MDYRKRAGTMDCIREKQKKSGDDGLLSRTEKERGRWTACVNRKESGDDGLLSETEKERGRWTSRTEKRAGTMDNGKKSWDDGRWTMDYRKKSAGTMDCFFQKKRAGTMDCFRDSRQKKEAGGRWTAFSRFETEKRAGTMDTAFACVLLFNAYLYSN
jgi:hypothetical protein